jgi:hypothetical protein
MTWEKCSYLHPMVADLSFTEKKSSTVGEMNGRNAASEAPLTL